MKMKVEDLCLSFGDKTVFDNLSLDIREGSITCILGRSGRGKSTLLRVLLGLQKIDRGSVALPDRFVPTVVFQDDRLIPTSSVIDNITFIGASKEEAEKYLSLVSLENEKDFPPHKLSGGMKRRAALARALARPGYTHCFLDEPFNGQDEKTKAALIGILKEELKGKTAVIITHSREDAALLADEIIEL